MIKLLVVVPCISLLVCGHKIMCEIVSRVKIRIHVVVLQVEDIIGDCLFSSLKFLLK